MTPLLVLALASSLASLAPPATAHQAPRPLRLYVFSRDSAFGFKDELLDLFRRDVGKYLESVSELAYDREDADVSVQFLGQGELTVELGDGTGSAHYLWRGDEEAERMWALVRVQKFSKEFSLAGSGSRDLSRLAKNIADWIRENSVAIRRAGSVPPR